MQQKGACPRGVVQALVLHGGARLQTQGDEPRAILADALQLKMVQQDAGHLIPAHQRQDVAVRTLQKSVIGEGLRQLWLLVLLLQLTVAFRLQVDPAMGTRA